LKKALLVNWDSYPNFTSGGVYTSIKTFIDNMQDWEFVIFNELSNSNSNGKYVVPSNVAQIIEIPMFGSNRYEEFYKENKSLLLKILRTKESIIKHEFLPLYRQFLSNLLTDNCDPKQLSQSIIELHKFLAIYDSKKCLEHYLTWETFLEQITKDPLYRHMEIKSVLTAFQVIQRNMQILSIQVPRVDLIHCSLAWLPSLVAIFAKVESNCPVVVTEHGVAFRELLLYYNGYLYDEPSKIFWKVFSRNVVRTIYSIADVITPVCHANVMWAKSLGADPSKIKVIYNGVNVKKFRPMKVKRETDKPTVVCLARIDPIKDIICLIQAIRYVREHIPNIQCLIYGTSTDLTYSWRCVDMVKNLELDNHVKFMGDTKEPEKAYNLADVVVISSISEGFPFAVIEAMACAKAIVASDVGGVREALEGCGMLVRSRRPHELAQAIVSLFKDKKLRNELEAAAVKKVREQFTAEQSVGGIRKLYDETINLYQHKQHQQIIEVINN
jgi:glycosyltransferase involved in cell wall biosynthesis